MCAHLFNGLLFTIVLIVVQSAEMKMVLGDSVIASYQSRRLFSSFGIYPSNNDIYIANRDSGTVSVIDGSGSFNTINLNSYSSTPSFEKLSLFLLG